MTETDKAVEVLHGMFITLDPDKDPKYKGIKKAYEAVKEAKGEPG